MYFCFSFLIYYKIGFMQLKLNHTTFPLVSSCRNWHPLSSHLVSCHGMGGNDFTNIFFFSWCSIWMLTTLKHTVLFKNTAWLLDTVLMITVSLENWRWVSFLLLMLIHLFLRLSRLYIYSEFLRISAIYKNSRVGIFHYVLKAWLSRSLYWKYKMEGTPLFWFNNHQFINLELQKIPY